MKKLLSLAAVVLFAVSHACAEMQNPIPLWPNGAPGAHGTNAWDIPNVTPYLPDATNATGAAMVICPGGGYGMLAPHEGHGYAVWLCQHGVTCFVLNYRLGSHGYRYPVEFEDVTRALRWVRAHAAEYHIDPQRLGIMGSSAGGHLAATLLTHFDAGNPQSSDVIERQSSRPDLGVLCYAVITMTDPYVNQGSRFALLGKDPSPKLLTLLSDELQVATNTPPCFLWSTFQDRAVPMENTMMFAEALRKHQVPFALHIYENGGHGMGLGNKNQPNGPLHPWTSDCLFWLKLHRFVK
jgi:acetyl esterase/lipase